MILTDTLSGTEPPLAAVGVTNSVYLQVHPDGKVTIWTKSVSGWGIKFVSAVSSEASLRLTSSGDSNNPVTHAYTYLNSGIIVKDANNAEVFRLWASSPDTGSNDNTRSVFFGVNAGSGSNTHDSVAIGFNALSGGDLAFGNVAIGSRALEAVNDVNADQNIAIGQQALQNLTTGFENTAIGYQAGKNLDSGIGNIAIGTNANIGSSTNNSIVIAHGVTNNSDNVAIIGNAQTTDAYFGSVSGSSILHGKGDAIVFPDSDPHVVGAAYWVLGVLTRSAG